MSIILVNILVFSNFCHKSPFLTINISQDFCGTWQTILSSEFSNWETGSCDSLDAFACEIEPGGTIHSVPKPTEEYHCPSPDDWKISYKLNPESQKCYSFSKNHPDGGNLWKGPEFAREFCSNYTAQLVTIHSEQEQNFISSLGVFSTIFVQNLAG